MVSLSISLNLAVTDLSFDFTMNNIGTTLEALVASGTGATAGSSISSGEDVPGIPEPTTLLLFASGLIGIGVMGHRRRKAAKTE